MKFTNEKIIALNRGATKHRGPTAIVIGGGLAGISAALSLADRGLQVTLLESRRRLGGRAGSFSTTERVQNQESKETVVDYCQHVGMGCCHELKRLIRRLGQDEAWTTHETLHFYGPNGRYSRLFQLPLLPPPLHIGHWLWTWPGLNWKDRLAIARGLLAISRIRLVDSQPELDNVPAQQWLMDHGQSKTAIENFWSTIVVSALGEETARVSLAAVTKVLQDGFLKTRGAFHLLVPNQPLDLLFNQQAKTKLEEAGVNVRLSVAAKSVNLSEPETRVTTDDETINADYVVLAVPWHKIQNIAIHDVDQQRAAIAESSPQLAASPISGIHTWWDRPWLSTPHAAIVGRMCQWVFPKPAPESNSATSGNSGKPHELSQQHYYQIVISASRQLPKDRGQVAHLLVDDLANVFPAVRGARLLRHQVVTDPNAVFSVACGSGGMRPPASTPYEKLWLAGDWTYTGWPATMEGAILSGFRVAESICDQAREKFDADW